MARPKKKEEKDPRAEWQRRLIRMREFQELHSRTWKRNEKLIFGEQSVTTGLANLESAISDSSNDLSYAWGLVKALETQIYVQNPDVFVESYNEALKEASARLTHIVNWDLDKMNIKALGNLGMVDNFIAGYSAIIECADTDTYVGEIGSEGGEGFEAGEVEMGETAVAVKTQQFGARRIHYWDILFDPQGKLLDLSDHRYIACAYYPTITSLKEDGFDLPKNIEEFPEASERTRQERARQPEMRVQNLNTRYRAAEKDPDFKTIAVWEIYDKVNRKLLYITDANEFLLGTRDWKPWLQIGPRELFPVTIMGMHPQPNSFYPKPELDLIARQLVELNQIEAIMREDSVTKWRKYVCLDKVVGPDWQSKITDTAAANSLMIVPADDLESIVGSQNMGQIDLRRLVVPLEDVSPPKDLPLRKSLIEADIQHIVGYGPGDRGGIPKTRSAREAVMLYERQNQKLAKRMDVINDFYRQFVSKHVMFLQQMMVEERYAKILNGKPGLSDFLQYTREDIQGDFEFDVIPGSSGPKTTESKRAMVMQEFQTLAPIIMQQGLNVRPLLEYVAQYMGWKTVDEIWGQQKLQAQQLAIALAGFQQGTISPEQLVDSAAKMVQAELTPAELGQVARMLQGGAPASQGSAPSAPGQRGDTAPLKTAMGQM